MKISAETLYLRQRLSDEGAIRLLANAGFDCIDYSMDHMVQDDSPLNAPDYLDYAHRLRQLGDELGITFNQAHAPFEFEWDKEGVIENVAIPRIIRCLEVASVLGVDTVIVHPLHYLNYFHNMQRVWDENVAFYRTLLPYAQQYNVRIALENLFQFDRRGIIVPDTCADAQRYIRALEEFNDPHLVACVDVGHAQLVGDSPAELIRALGHDRVKALHIHDNDSVLDRHTLPYLGKIDWDDLAKALADIDYDGVFTFESFLFYANFETDFLPIAARWICEMGRYLGQKIESYKAENKLE